MVGASLPSCSVLVCLLTRQNVQRPNRDYDRLTCPLLISFQGHTPGYFTRCLANTHIHTHTHTNTKRFLCLLLIQYLLLTKTWNILYSLSFWLIYFVFDVAIWANFQWEKQKKAEKKREAQQPFEIERTSMWVFIQGQGWPHMVLDESTSHCYLCRCMHGPTTDTNMFNATALLI